MSEKWRAIGSRSSGRQRAPAWPQTGRGEIIGELSLFTGGSRVVSITAVEDGYLAVFSFSQLEGLKRTNPPLALKLNRQLARFKPWCLLHTNRDTRFSPQAAVLPALHTLNLN